MSKPVRVPDPVYERIEREAERKDSPKSEIVRDWMEAVDELKDLKAENPRL